MREESKCPICSNETISGIAFDNACTVCDYIEEEYPDANTLGYWESTYGTDDY